MPFSLLPRIVARELPDLTPELLRNLGIRLLLLDFDNTIIPYTSNIPEEKITAWLESVKESGVFLCVVSNSKRDRAKKFCQAYGIDCVTHAKKPFPHGIRRALRQYDLPRENCAMVGDQIFTDTLGANCAGVLSILVKSIDNHNFWLKARHVLEKPFIILAGNRRIQS